MATQLQAQSNDGLERSTLKGSDGLDHIGQHFNEGYFDNVLGGFAKRTITDLRRRATSFNDKRETFNPKLTPAQNCENLKRELKEFDEHSIRELSKVASEFKREIGSLEFDLNEDANLYERKDRILSIVGSFHAKSNADQQQAIADALEEDDGPMLAVLVNSSKVETGLSKSDRELIRRRAWEKAAPQRLKAYDELKSAAERWEAGCYGIVTVKQKMATGLNRYDADIERAEAVHGIPTPTMGFAE